MLNCNMYCPYDFYNGIRKIKENGHEMITLTSLYAMFLSVLYTFTFYIE